MAQKKILIIEDEKAMAHALELKLKHEGFDTELAHDGQEGLALYEKSGADLIILDLIMPALDGFGVLERLHALRGTTPVIVLSNLSQEEDERRVLELGARAFFIKSDVPIAHIVENVKTALARAV